MNIRQIILSIAIFLVSIIIFQIVSPYVSKPAADIYGMLSQPLFRLMVDSDKRIIENETEQLKGEGYYLIKIKIGNIQYAAPDGRILSKVQRANVRSFILIPSMLIVILFMATPLNIRYRLIYSGIGLVFTNIFIFFKLLVFFLSGKPGEFQTVEISDTLISIINLLSSLLVTETEMGTTVFISIIIWLAILFISGSTAEIKKNLFPAMIHLSD